MCLWVHAGAGHVVAVGVAANVGRDGGHLHAVDSIVPVNHVVKAVLPVHRALKSSAAMFRVLLFEIQESQEPVSSSHKTRNGLTIHAAVPQLQRMVLFRFLSRFRKRFLHKPVNYMTKGISG